MKLLNLPIDVTYRLLRVFENDQATDVCSNCNMPIRRVAVIESFNGVYAVGVDCATTLTTQAGSNHHLAQQLKVAKREITRIVKAKKLLAQGATATLFGKYLVVCYSEGGYSKYYETVPMFTDPSTQLAQELTAKYNDAPRLTCLADCRNYATAIN